jgi:formate dehydrogenase subunit gamma
MPKVNDLREKRMSEILTAEERARDHEPRVIVRHTFGIRLVHWWTALMLFYLILSGFALGYPRMAWLFDLLGGGQTVRFLHPWVGLGFTVGLIAMTVMWWRSMTFISVDWEWFRKIGIYVRTGHTPVDSDEYNAGQKAYFWFSIFSGVLLLITGIPLWFPDLMSREWNLTNRFAHHVLFLFTIGSLAIHVYLSTAAFPGTFRAMTSGTVSRAWAAFHHPRWFRRVDSKEDD